MKHVTFENWSFEQKVDRWILQSLSKGASNFAEMLATMPGVYPTAAHGGVKRLRKKGLLPSPTADLLLFQAREYSTKSSSYAYLPPPHPLNYEWRFDRETSQKLITAAVKDFLIPSDRALLLGTPTVAMAAIELGVSDHVAFLGEANAISGAISGLANVSLNAPEVISNPEYIRSGAFRSVVLDPPWYDECLLEMLPLAARAVKAHGTVLIVAAPAGARRSALEHRLSLIQIAKDCGLSLKSEVLGFAKYQTPFFEANALKAAGLALPGDWRSADLLEFTKSGVGHGYHLAQVRLKRTWKELTLGRMRVFVNLSESDDRSAALQLRSIVAGDVLPTVSRRDPRRQSANVWTSGNRIFHCDKPYELVQALQGDFLSFADLGGHDPCRPYNARKFQDYAKLKYHLQNLSNTERQEENLHFGGRSGSQRNTILRAPRAVTRKRFLGAAFGRDNVWYEGV